MKIARATKDHLSSLVSLSQEWARQMGYIVDDKDIWDDMSRMIDTGIIYMVLYQEQIIGMMSGICYPIFWTGEKVAEEHWFFVSPNHRKRGVGKVLEKAFRGWAVTRGCHSVIITPNKYGDLNPKGVADFLEKEGYEVHGYRMKRSLDVLKQDIANH